MPNYDERYAVRNEPIERALKTMAGMLEEHLPEGWAFGLFLVPYGINQPAPEGLGSVFWISNGDRAGMVDAVKGWIEDLERRNGGPLVPR